MIAKPGGGSKCRRLASEIDLHANALSLLQSPVILACNNGKGALSFSEPHCESGHGCFSIGALTIRLQVIDRGWQMKEKRSLFALFTPCTNKYFHAT